MPRRTRFWVGLLAALVSSSTLANPADFPRSPALTVPIEFWKSVFAKYTKYHVILHDDFYLDKVVEVIDYSALAPRGMDDDQLRVWVNRESAKALLYAKQSFEEAQAAGDDPSQLKGQAKRIWEMYRDVNEPNRYLAARDRLRLQHGIRERYARALTESSRYLPRMESTFRGMGLPIELTRLPFVESSFNVKAYSAAKAAGIWQFIPSAARMYMRLNNVVDDRRDPWFSTEAAARHLRDDYNSLGAWPLAITAYNQGRYSMIRAVNELGTKDMGAIINRYKGPRFKFAGRNFYPEFCAAVDIAAEPERYFASLSRAPELNFDEVTTKRRLSYETLRRMSGASKDEFLTLNPSYRPEVIRGKMLVPAGHRIRVPSGQAVAFNAAYGSSSAELARADQEEDRSVATAEDEPAPVSNSGTIRRHRVKRGDTLAAIARRYGVDVADIKRANGLKSVHRLHVGQSLKLPGGKVQAEQRIAAKPLNTNKSNSPAVSAAPTIVATASPKPEKSTPVKSGEADFEQAAMVVEHRLASGQTLNELARKYGSSTKAIQEANGIKNMRSIRAGRMLKIPVGDRYAAKLKSSAKPAAAVASTASDSAGKRSAADTAKRKGMLSEMLATTDLSVAPKPAVSAASMDKEKPAAKAAARKSAAVTQHNVSAGETIWNIAKQYNTSVAAIKTANGLRSTKRIKVGQTLVIPGSTDDRSPL